MLAARTSLGIRGIAALRPVARTSVRSIQTVHNTPKEEDVIITAQRAHRPVSPHLQIYQPQLPFVMSGVHRITGVALAGAFYGLTCTYAATSLLGVPFDSATLITAFAGLPVIAKGLIKAAGAYPFFYHSLNGVRHLIWDAGKELRIPQVYRTGYVVLAGTALLATYYAFF